MILGELWVIRRNWYAALLLPPKAIVQAAHLLNLSIPRAKIAGDGIKNRVFVLTHLRFKIQMHVLTHISFCSLDMIGHLETFTEDVRYMTKKVPYLQKFANVGEKSNVGSKMRKEEEYLSQLSTEQKQYLCDIFKWDFIMFNYTCF